MSGEEDAGDIDGSEDIGGEGENIEGEGGEADIDLTDSGEDNPEQVGEATIKKIKNIIRG
jgi:hypothetical protein